MLSSVCEKHNSLYFAYIVRHCRAKVSNLSQKSRLCIFFLYVVMVIYFFLQMISSVSVVFSYIKLYLLVWVFGAL